MASTYEWLAQIAQSAGLLYFVALFVAVSAYALWPKNRATFDAAARLPLQED
jgi:cytochrome c oxidase cbb3-type subunit IV